MRETRGRTFEEWLRGAQGTKISYARPHVRTIDVDNDVTDRAEAFWRQVPAGGVGPHRWVQRHREQAPYAGTEAAERGLVPPHEVIESRCTEIVGSMPR